MVTSTRINNTSNDIPKSFYAKTIMVGPFEVRVTNKQHYRLYTATLRGVCFLKQASYPSPDQLCDGLSEKVRSREIASSDAAPYLKAAAPLCHRPSVVGLKEKQLINKR